MAGLFSSFFDIGMAIGTANNDKAIGKRRYGENADYRISDSTRAALNAAKIRAGDIGSTDQQRASSQAALANMETGLGFMTDYAKLDTVSNETGIDITGAGRNVSEGIANSNALAKLRYPGSDQQIKDDYEAYQQKGLESSLNLMDTFAGAVSGTGGGGGYEAVDYGGHFQDVGGSPNVIDNNYGISAPDYSGVYGGQTIDNNFGMSQPQQAGIPDYLSQQTPEVNSMNQQDIVSMLLNLLNKNKPRA